MMLRQSWRPASTPRRKKVEADAPPRSTPGSFLSLADNEPNENPPNLKAGGDWLFIAPCIRGDEEAFRIR